MKTIKNLDGTVSRLSDAEAEEIVKDGRGVYCPKSEWKKNNPSKKKEPVKHE